MNRTQQWIVALPYIMSIGWAFVYLGEKVGRMLIANPDMRELIFFEAVSIGCWLILIYLGILVHSRRTIRKLGDKREEEST